MENFKNTASDNESNITENEVIPELKENQNKDNDVILDNIKEEISQKEKIINDTLNSIDNIRTELGLEVSNDIPLSVQQNQESINKLKKDKAELEGLDFTIVEPEIEETPEEYISRSMKCIIEDKINDDKNLDNINPLLKNRNYYGKRTNNVIFEFFSDMEKTGEIKNILSNLELNENRKFSKDKSDYIFNELNNKIWSSSRESADGDDNKKIDYYNNTNQERDFFSYNRKTNDAYSYASMMFALPDAFTEKEEGKEYLHNQLDNKTIFLFGGGDSIKDLLKSEEFKPKKVINFDPFLKEEAFDKNPNDIYESQIISASDKKIREMTDKNEISKADEVWATYSVPFYLDSSNDIKELITNMSEVLNEGGNARISPIAVQSTEKFGENFEMRKQSLVDSIKSLLDNPDYNVTIFNDTLKIHKIKKETKQ